MNSLSKVFLWKIALTLLIWCLPLLILQASALVWLGFPVPEPQLFLRLLGMAYAALLVGYGFGLKVALRGGYPEGVVWVGIVSNLGACLLLGVAAGYGVWASWGEMAKAIMWISLLGTGMISAGLVRFGIYGKH